MRNLFEEMGCATPMPQSFVDFVADGLQLKKRGKSGLLILGMVLCPPFLFSLVYPDLFLMALNYASAFGAVILFGILPACMVLQGRSQHSGEVAPLVAGGRFPLFIVIAISLFIAGLQLYRDWLAPWFASWLARGGA